MIKVCSKDYKGLGPKVKEGWDGSREIFVRILVSYERGSIN